MKDLDYSFRNFVKIQSAWRLNAGVWFMFVGYWFLWGTQAAFCKEYAPRPLKQSSYETTASNVEMKNGLLSVNARQTPWKDLLNQIRNETRIPIHYTAPATAVTTVTFSALPVKEALERLFGPGADFVFRYPKGSPQLQEVWVVGSIREENTQQALTNTGTVKDVPQEAGQNDVETVDELVERARSDENAQSRVQALASLSGAGQPDATAAKLALETALNDKDSSVREYAVQTLASQDGEEATEHLRQALQDPDSGVRIKAIENVPLKGQGIALIQEALSNPDKSVQAIAEDRLQQVTQ